MENKKIYINDIELPEQPTELNIEHCFNFVYPTGSCDCSIKIKEKEFNFIAYRIYLNNDSIYLYTMEDTYQLNSVG